LKQLKEALCRSVPFIAAFLMILPVWPADAQSSPRVPMQGYTWLTPPDPAYPDPQNNLLTDRQPGDPSRLVNGGWAGHLGSARVVFRLGTPKTIDFFSIQILDRHVSGIETPAKVFFTCFSDSASSTVEVPIEAQRLEGAFEIGNPARLAKTCKEVALNIVAGTGYWIFLGEVSFFAAQEVKQ
jgi:hypothetical protein